jgi:hypothetical protein
MELQGKRMPSSCSNTAGRGAVTHSWKRSKELPKQTFPKPLSAAAHSWSHGLGRNTHNPMALLNLPRIWHYLNNPTGLAVGSKAAAQPGASYQATDSYPNVLPWLAPSSQIGSL